MAIKYFVLAFISLQLVTSIKISPNLKGNLQSQEQFDKLINSLEGYKPECKRTQKLIDEEVAFIRIDYISSLLRLTENVLPELKKFQELASEIGQEAVEFVNTKITTLYTTEDNGKANINRNCDQKSVELSNIVRSLQERIDSSIETANAEWESCNGDECENVIANLQKEVKAIGDVVSTLFIDIYNELTVLKGDNGSIFLNYHLIIRQTIESFEEYFELLRKV